MNAYLLAFTVGTGLIGCGQTTADPDRHDGPAGGAGASGSSGAAGAIAGGGGSAGTSSGGTGNEPIVPGEAVQFVLYEQPKSESVSSLWAQEVSGALTPADGPAPLAAAVQLSDAERAWSPKFTSDGMYVAFADGDLESSVHLHVADLTRRVIERAHLVTEARRLSAYEWSPDGRWLAWLEEPLNADPPVLKVLPTEAIGTEIDQGSVRVFAAAGGGTMFWLSGNRLAFHEPSGTLALLDVGGPTPTVPTVPSDIGLELGAISASSDGNFALLSTPFRTEHWILDARRAELLPLPADGVWSASADFQLFARGVGNDTELVAGVDGFPSGPAQVWPGAWVMRFSPRGSMAALITGNGVSLVRVRDGRIEERVIEVQHAVHEAEFSAEGDRLVFVDDDLGVWQADLEADLSSIEPTFVALLDEYDTMSLIAGGSALLFPKGFETVVYQELAPGGKLHTWTVDGSVEQARPRWAGRINAAAYLVSDEESKFVQLVSLKDIERKVEFGRCTLSSTYCTTMQYWIQP